MNRFDDLLPEEIEPQHKELITLLQRAYSRPVTVPSTEQAQIIAQVQARLVQTANGDSFNRDVPLPQIGVLDSFPHQAVSPTGKPRRDKRRFPLMALIAAAMLISMLLSAFLLFLVPRFSSTDGSSASASAITLSSTVVNVKSGPQQVLMQIVKFEPGTSVLLTHDVQEMV
ncbi:MAG TPA: hypothetical protein VKR83_06950, partial [Ktedonobacteraceae bacterium]|nr:hypothetical protein [Ktedonobacteraceae bacterium]